MRKTVSAALLVAMTMLGMPPGVFAAAGKPAAKRQDQATIKGQTKGANGETLSQTKVRVRNSNTGNIAADLTTDSAGSFVGVVPAGSYVIEVVGANGAVIGLSPVVTVAAGATASITVTASAVAAVAGAAGAGAAGAAGGGFGLFGLGAVATIAVLGGATAATIVGIKAAKGNGNNGNGTPGGQTASPAR